MEYAQSLLYLLDRHKPAANTKGVNSKNVTLNKAFKAYKKASALSLNKNRIKYTRQLSELAVSLKKKTNWFKFFDELLQHQGDEKGTYLAHIDYADGLARFKDKAAETHFLSSINMRTPVDGVEANYRYANYLLDKNKPREALSVLDKFTFEERRMYVHIALLRQKIMHQLKMDTQEVDDEVKLFRKNLSQSPFIGAIPKLSNLVMQSSADILGISRAYALNYYCNCAYYNTL